MGSTRLPGKVLADINGQPMLWHVVQRARAAREIDEVRVATSMEPANDPLAEWCRQTGTPCFRGHESDVLDRYCQAARAAGAGVIVRLTADCPLLDPAIVDRVVALRRTHDAHYASNSVQRTYPDGLDAEAFTMAALERAWSEASWASEREHVTPYIWKHPDRFRLAHVTQDVDLSGLRWTVDQPEDLEFVREVSRYYGSRFPGMVEVLEFLRTHSDLAARISGRVANEGYQKSLREDIVIGERNQS